MNEGLLSAYANIEAWQTIQTVIKKPTCCAIFDIASGEKPLLSAALANEGKRSVVIVCPSDRIAQQHAQDIERVTGQSCVVLPARDLQFSRAASSRESTYHRLQTLHALSSNTARILCVSIDALLDRCVPRAQFVQAGVKLSQGLRFAPDALLAKLLSTGYERVSMVEGCGQCALRGSILDIFPPNESNALRIEFFDDEIDSIRTFDPISQRSLHPLKQAYICPATECLIQDPISAADRLHSALKASNKEQAEHEAKQQVIQDGLSVFLSELDALEKSEELIKAHQTMQIEKTNEDRQARNRHLGDVALVRAGQVIRTAPMWLEVLLPKCETVLDYLHDPIVICDNPEQFSRRIGARQSEFDHAFEEALARGDAFGAQKQCLFPYHELLASFDRHPVIALSDVKAGLGQLKPKTLIDFHSSPSMPYQNQMEMLCKDIEKWKADGFCIVLMAGGEARGKRLQKMLSDHSLPAVYCDRLDGNLIKREIIVLPTTCQKGFINTQTKLALISDSDIYGTAYQRARKKSQSGEKIASFTDLNIGDYVVHDLHGVGIYRGIVQMDSDRIKRDYLLIHYADNDKLYVPADQFDRITKFIGAEHSAPKLNRLGGGEWEKQKNKVKAGLKKLAFDLVELYAKRSNEVGYAFSQTNPWKQEFEDMFPYELTIDQDQSVAQIESDMERPINMDRLLCGDVGYGKTEVALRAAFKAVVEGKQVALLAPTTILVQQHYQTILKRFQGFPVRCDMLSRFRTPKEQREVLSKLKEGSLDIVVGTHRLLGKDVVYHDLGLLIVDEEHRFGVNHKEKIKHLKTRVDVLTMSATPIPRTLHMSMVGIRDMSILETPPEERLPVKTFVTEYDENMIRDAINRELSRGGQVFFLYNRVRSMEQMHARIQQLVPQARIGIAHGQMRENALEDIMLDFYAGAYDVLLCTTIVENGLDVPDANTLIVFDADRFGLSQLYQIRGRVGRSNRQAYAYFTTRADKQLSEMADKRLSAIREFTEFGAGYRIAMRDLEIRGAGDVLGPEQSGHLTTVGYDMYLKLIEQAVGEAKGIMPTPELDTRIELRIDAFLPQNYVSDERLRVEIYKRIAMVDGEDMRLEIAEELIDRFGDVPKPVDNLMQIAHLRGITRKLGISLVSLRDDGVLMRLDERFVPELGIFYQAITTVDERLIFRPDKIPTLFLSQKMLSAEDALPVCMKLLSAVLFEVKNLQKLQKDKCES